MSSISFPSDTSDPIILSDWIELLAITEDDGNASHGDLQRVLNRLGIENADELCKDTMTELRKRTVAAGQNYPFTFSGTLLKTKNDWQKFTPYVFCLLLSYCPDKMKKIKGLRHEIMFEQLSCLAAKNYIGGDVVRFGSPRQELPSSFKDAINFICGKIGEWDPRPVSSLSHKDDGLDVIAWKPFPDSQVGKLILFGHCASGGNWNSKINELQPLDFCSNWLGGEKSPIVKTFFIPHRIQSDVFEDRATHAKLFFDRCRISYWASNDDFNKITKSHNLKWCKNLLEKIVAQKKLKNKSL